ncbi:hypothetical protein [Halomonas sp. BC2]|nr:hypothetical protein [Halomonas sp. BC2]
MDGTLADGDWGLVDRSNRDPKQEGVFLLLVSGGLSGYSDWRAGRCI